MSQFNFENFGEIQRDQERDNEGNINYYSDPYGERLIDGQVYYLKRKKPPTPYALFIKERLPQMKMENPRGDVGKFFIDLGKEWHYMDSAKKCEFYMKYNDEVKKFDLLKKSLPLGIDPRLRVISKERDFNSSTKRPKYSNDNHSVGNRYLGQSDDGYEEDHMDGHFDTTKMDDDEKFSSNRKYNEPMEVIQIQNYKLGNQIDEDSLSDSHSSLLRSTGISRKFEKKYHSD